MLYYELMVLGKNIADIYVNYDYDQVLMVSNLGVMSSDAGKSYMYITGSGDYSIAYRYLEYVEKIILVRESG